jgi:hypothetical protein
MHALANLIAVVHIAYFLFIVLGTLAILVGPRLGWTWVRSLPFRLLHLAAVYVVLVEEVFGIACPLSVMQWDLRSATGGPVEATEGLGGILDGLLFRTIPGWALDVLYWSTGVGLLALLFLVPPIWRRKPQPLRNV